MLLVVVLVMLFCKCLLQKLKNPKSRIKKNIYLFKKRVYIMALRKAKKGTLVTPKS